MTSRNGAREGRYVAYYIIVMMLFLGCVALCAMFVSKNFLRQNERDAVLLADFKHRQNAEALNDFLYRASFALESAAMIVDYLIASGEPVEKIQEFMALEMKRASKQTDSLSGNVFGVVNGEFVHDGDWLPGDEYMPLRRPWYKDAVRTHGRVVVGKPFTSTNSAKPVISFSKSLLDEKNVVAFTLPLASLSRFIASRKEKVGDIWMVMDRDGLVIASSGEIRQGFDCLSSEAWGMDEEKLAREILLAGEKPFEFVYHKDKYMVFSMAVQNGWNMVSLVKKSQVFGHSRVILVQVLVVFGSIFIVIVVLCTITLINRIRVVRSVRRKSDFLDSVAKELRTPLNGILGMTRILLRDARDESVHDYVKNVQVASIGLLSVVHEVQEIAKIESGEFVLNPVQYELYSVLKDCFDTVSPRATAKNLHFSLECDPDIPSSLWGDEDRIRQIIVNLLTNAILYTELGEVRLIISYDVIPNQGEQRLDECINLKITVKDSGVGIRDENTDSILGLFQMMNEPKPAGTRFSLSLTKKLISMCGGEIIVKSRFGEGATYMVSIPQLVLNVEPMGDFATRYKNGSEKESLGSEMLFAPAARILAVDDAELNLKVIRGLLKETRVQIDTALNGSQCLDMVQVRHYDLILLDNMMPMMDGRETFERMKRLSVNLCKDTPVVIMIAGPVPVDKESYLSVGIADYIPKPLMEEDLLRALKWYLPKHLVLTREDLNMSPYEEMSAKNLEEETSALLATYDKVNGFYQVASSESEKKKKRELVGDLELDMVTPQSPNERLSVFEDVLDVKLGLGNCINDEEFFREMLSEFLLDDKRKELERAYDSGEWMNYQILVHALRGTARTIGAEELSRDAKSIEMACKEGKIDYVRKRHVELIASYANVLRKIREGLNAK